MSDYLHFGDANTGIYVCVKELELALMHYNGKKIKGVKGMKRNKQKMNRNERRGTSD